MDECRNTPGESHYNFHFSDVGYKNIRNLGHKTGKRSVENMTRLVALTLLRDPVPRLNGGEYNAHDISVTKAIGMSDAVHAKLVRIAHANGVPPECLGEMLANYAVTV